MAVTGDDILNTLHELRRLASINEITEHLFSKKKEGSQTALKAATKEIIEAGVRFGCIIEEENKFRCKNQIKSKEIIGDVSTDTNKETGKKSDNEMGSSHGAKKKRAENKKRKAEEIKLQNISSDDNDDDESEDDGDAALCYGPSSRRRRSRARARSRSARRRSSRRKRRHG